MRDELLKSSEHRLWELIAERARPGVDLKALDQRIWDLFGETWAVMFTDLSGFSRQVEKFGILHFLQIILEHKEMLSPIIQRHDGILIKTIGNQVSCSQYGNEFASFSFDANRLSDTIMGLLESHWHQLINKYNW